MLEKINVLIPMSGKAQRFKDAGYALPKFLLPIEKKPMIQKVVENLNVSNARYIFLTLKEHYEQYNLQYLLPLICRDKECEIVQVESVTEGAACTALLAKNLINGDQELLIANSDQLVEWSPERFISYMRRNNAKGGILTFHGSNPKWSYAKLKEETNEVVEVAEKNPISNFATVGIYYFRYGIHFVHYAEQMIKKNIRVNNEFYICPVFNEMIGANCKVLAYQCEEMNGVGDPVSYENYLKKLEFQKKIESDAVYDCN